VSSSGTSQPWPWQDRPSILSAIRAWDGRTSLPLPDEPPAANRVRYASGALDGIVTHHLGSASARDQADVVSSVLFSLERLARTGGDHARGALYELVMRGSVAAHADAIVDRLAEQRRLTRGEVRDAARWLIGAAAHREPLKLGIVLLGVSGEPEDVTELMLLGRHDEFTLYAAVAVANLVDDPTDLWWQMARAVRGWGKIHLVERLAPLAARRPDLAAWLLREGCANEVMNEYLAYLCASEGGLGDALDAVTPEGADDALIDGACRIVGALLRGGPAEDIDSYADGARVVTALLGVLEKRCDRLPRLALVSSVRAWLRGGVGRTLALEDGVAAPPLELWQAREAQGFTAEVRRALTARCEAVLARPAWRGQALAAYLGDDVRERRLAWQLGEAIGLDLWPVGLERLHAEPLEDSLWWELLQSSDPGRIAQVVALAEAVLPLAAIATGPADDLGRGPTYQAHTCLDFVLQELGRHRVFSAALTVAGLRSPTVRNRTLAAGLLEVVPPAQWSAEVVAALQRAAAEEPRPDLQARLAERLGEVGR